VLAGTSGNTTITVTAFTLSGTITFPATPTGDTAVNLTMNATGVTILIRKLNAGVLTDRLKIVLTSLSINIDGGDVLTFAFDSDPTATITFYDKNGVAAPSTMVTFSGAATYTRSTRVLSLNITASGSLVLAGTSGNTTITITAFTLSGTITFPATPTGDTAVNLTLAATGVTILIRKLNAGVLTDRLKIEIPSVSITIDGSDVFTLNLSSTSATITFFDKNGIALPSTIVTLSGSATYTRSTRVLALNFTISGSLALCACGPAHILIDISGVTISGTVTFPSTPTGDTVMALVLTGSVTVSIQKLSAGGSLYTFMTVNTSAAITIDGGDLLSIGLGSSTSATLNVYKSDGTTLLSGTYQVGGTLPGLVGVTFDRSTKILTVGIGVTGIVYLGSNNSIALTGLAISGTSLCQGDGLPPVVDLTFTGNVVIVFSGMSLAATVNLDFTTGRIDFTGLGTLTTGIGAQNPGMTTTVAVTGFVTFGAPSPTVVDITLTQPLVFGQLVIDTGMRLVATKPFGGSWTAAISGSLNIGGGFAMGAFIGTAFASGGDWFFSISVSVSSGTASLLSLTGTLTIVGDTTPANGIRFTTFTGTANIAQGNLSATLTFSLTGNTTSGLTGTGNISLMTVFTLGQFSLPFTFVNANLSITVGFNASGQLTVTTVTFLNSVIDLGLNLLILKAVLRVGAPVLSYNHATGVFSIALANAGIYIDANLIIVHSHVGAGLNSLTASWDSASGLHLDGTVWFMVMADTIGIYAGLAGRVTISVDQDVLSFSGSLTFEAGVYGVAAGIAAAAAAIIFLPAWAGWAVAPIAGALFLTGGVDLKLTVSASGYVDLTDGDFYGTGYATGKAELRVFWGLFDIGNADAVGTFTFTSNLGAINSAWSGPGIALYDARMYWQVCLLWCFGHSWGGNPDNGFKDGVVVWNSATGAWATCGSKWKNPYIGGWEVDSPSTASSGSTPPLSCTINWSPPAGPASLVVNVVEGGIGVIGVAVQLVTSTYGVIPTGIPQSACSSQSNHWWESGVCWTHGNTEVIAGTGVTGADGSVTIATSAPGTYSIRILTPAGWVNIFDPDGVPANGIAPGFASPGGFFAYTFGISAPTTVSGTVFADLNGNGVKDPYDYFLSNIGLVLRRSNGSGGWYAVANQSTNTSGQYAFPAVLGGSYQVDVIQPINWTVSTNNDLAPVTVSAGSTSDTPDFGLRPPRAAVIGKVFYDKNKNGVHEPAAGEYLMNRTVRLWIDTNNDGTFDYQFATGSSGTAGQYSIPDVPVGFNYRLTVVPGLHHQVTTNNSPHVFFVGSTTGAYGTVFGLADRKMVAVEGGVYADVDHNGLINGTDYAMAGVAVELLNSSQMVVATSSTGADGRFIFPDLVPGSYETRVLLPNANWAYSVVPGCTTQACVSTGKVSAALPDFCEGESGCTNDYSVPAGSYALSGPAACVAGTKNPICATGATLTGTLREDTDRSGTVTAGDAGYVGSVELIDTATGTTVISTSGSAGGWSFANVAPGSYEVRVAGDLLQVVAVVDPDAVANKVAPVTVAGANIAVGTFLVRDASQLGGTAQVSGPVRLSSGACPTGMEVQLLVETAVVASALISSPSPSEYCTYKFTRVPAGTYTVKLVRNGAVVLQDPDSVLDGQTVITVVEAGITSVGSFWLQAGNGSVTGVVYLDEGSKSLGVGDTCATGMRVELRVGASVAAVTGLGADCTYNFNNVVPQGYELRVLVNGHPVYADPDGVLDARTIVAPEANVAKAVGPFLIGPPATGTATLTGNVDYNGSGCVPANNWMGYRLYNGATLVATGTFSQSTCTFTFVNVPAGAYTVKLSLADQCSRAGQNPCPYSWLNDPDTTPDGNFDVNVTGVPVNVGTFVYYYSGGGG